MEALPVCAGPSLTDVHPTFPDEAEAATYLIYWEIGQTIQSREAHIDVVAIGEGRRSAACSAATAAIAEEQRGVLGGQQGEEGTGLV